MTLKPGQEYGNVWVNPDTGKRTHLSGHNYIPMMLNDDSLGWGVRATPIYWKRCTHEFTCCIECIDDWATDYEVQWQRTAGGRKMFAEIQRRVLAGDMRPVRGVPVLDDASSH